MKQEAARRRKQGCSPSAISRYLGSDATLVALPRLFSHRFNPLYRGTWFPTTVHLLGSLGPHAVSIRYIAVLGFQPAEGSEEVFFGTPFQSAISRYLVSNRRVSNLGGLQLGCFNPLYRGTWFPTAAGTSLLHFSWSVSIRYIAVLGFQPYQKNTPSDQRRRKRFTHPPSNRSHSHICFLKSR